MWFVGGTPSSTVVDESAIELVYNLLNTPCPALQQSPTGWTKAVADAFYTSCVNAGYTRLPNLFPFIVGGVGCATTAHYHDLCTLAAVGNAWNALVVHPTETTLRDAHNALNALQSVQTHMLPDSVLSRIAAYAPTIQQAINCIQAIHDIDDQALTVPAGLFASSYDCIDVNALVQMFIGRNIVACHTALAADFAMELLSDAKAWCDIYTVTDAVVLHSVEEIKVLVKSAQRTHQEVAPSTTASDAVHLWVTAV